jgi:hypothetical protein
MGAGRTRCGRRLQRVSQGTRSSGGRSQATARPARRDLRGNQVQWDNTATGDSFVSAERGFSQPFPLRLKLSDRNLFPDGPNRPPRHRGRRHLVRDMKTGRAYPRQGKIGRRSEATFRSPSMALSPGGLAVGGVSRKSWCVLYLRWPGVWCRGHSAVITKPSWSPRLASGYAPLPDCLPSGCFRAGGVRLQVLLSARSAATPFLTGGL